MPDIKYRIKSEYIPYTDWFLTIPAIFNDMGEELYTKRNVVRKVVAPDGSNLTVKRFKEPNFLQKIVYSFFRKSKASRAYSHARFLLSHKILTPGPVAFIEEYHGGLMKYCYFVSSYAPGKSCWELNHDLSNGQLAHSLAEFYATMHENGFMHGDPNLSNFMYNHVDNRYVITTLDLNRSYLIPHPSKEDCLCNFMRLTHEIPTMERIVSDYADIRHWNGERCVEYVKSRIRALERQEDIRGALTMKEPEYRKRRRLRLAGEM